MKVSLDWLCDHIDLRGKSVAEIDEMLTFSGVEVEGVETLPELVVVAKILTSVKHPGADKLSVVTVDDGTGTPRQIVCGAKNYAVGDQVPLALPGCQLAPDFKIKAGKLRGEQSDGMLCSAKELGMEDEVDGLMILDQNLTPGIPLTEVFPPVFDLEVTPNRPDCLSHLGIARELSVLSGNSLKGDADHAEENVKRSHAGVKTSAPEACPLYTARMIRGVKVAESPAWLKTKLTSIGLRPINNIVDITNFVLMEMGQPLHAFDVKKLSGGINVRPARDGEKILALDGEEYSLEPGDLVIADFEKPVAIAGVMGGEGTGVTESTVDVLLESAYFAPPGIRRTARRLNLSSDSSYRFERGVDPQQVIGASLLATRLILEIAGGKADDEILIDGEAPVLVGEVELDPARVGQLMGAPISDDEIARILGGLGLEQVSGAPSQPTTTWKIPGFRLDLQRPIDLIEEIARVYGLDKVEPRRSAHFADISPVDRFYDFAYGLARQLTGLGFFEARTIKLVSAAQLADHVFSKPEVGGIVALKNPLTDDHTHMRPSVLPGLIAVAGRNIRMGTDRLRLFEAGTVFSVSKESGPAESQALGILVSGPEGPVTWQDPDPAPADFFSLLGIVGSLDHAGRITIEKSDRPGLVLAVDVFLGTGKRRVKIGSAGQLAPARARDLDSRHPVYVAEISLDALFTVSDGSAKFEELPRFPAVTRDVAMEVPADLPNAEVAKYFSSLDEDLLESFEIFDVFADPAGEKLAADRKSLAYSLTYRSQFKTLQTSEVDTAHGGILEGLKKALPVSLR